VNSVHRLPVTPSTADDDTIVARLARLLRLEVELGLAEARGFIRSILLAVAIAVPAAIALIASLVVLLAAALAPLFDARWEPLLIAGGGVALLALAGLAWSAWRLTHLSWPIQTLRSFEENWQWLATQLRSRLTLRSRAA
jgi:Putative Actinobacterial Holin-X, holin superfamily III